MPGGLLRGCGAHGRPPRRPRRPRRDAPRDLSPASPFPSRSASGTGASTSSPALAPSSLAFALLRGRRLEARLRRVPSLERLASASPEAPGSPLAVARGAAACVAFSAAPVRAERLRVRFLEEAGSGDNSFSLAALSRRARLDLEVRDSRLAFGLESLSELVLERDWPSESGCSLIRSRFVLKRSVGRSPRAPLSRGSPGPQGRSEETGGSRGAAVRWLAVAPNEQLEGAW